MRTKVTQVILESVDQAGTKLSPTHVPASAISRVTAAYASPADDESRLLKIDSMAQHITDWQADAAFIVALALRPEAFTNEEVRTGVESLLSHVPSHITTAKRIAHELGIHQEFDDKIA